jgi:hypothetical protein
MMHRDDYCQLFVKKYFISLKTEIKKAMKIHRLFKVGVAALNLQPSRPKA